MRPWCRLPLALAFTAAVVLPAIAHADDAETLALKERAKQFWEARVRDDFAAVWDLLSPAEQARVTRENYATYQKEKGPFLFLSAEVLDAVAQKEVGWVLVSYSVRPRQFDVKPRLLKVWDVWERDENGWHQCARTQLVNWPRKPPRERSADEEAALAKRIDAMWAARKAQDWRTVWSFLDPGYRASTTLEEYLSRTSKYDYVGYEIAWTEAVDASSGRAKVVYDYKYNDRSMSKMAPQTTASLEEWVKVDGEWYRRVGTQQDTTIEVEPPKAGDPPGKPGDTGSN